jgi:hypothetical protein
MRAMPNYPPTEGPVPQVFTDQHIREWEQQLQNLAVANAIIQKCERCGIPVQTSRQDCDALCSFFQAMLAEERGQQTPNPLALT